MSLTAWIANPLRLEVNATQSGTGRPWERKFLGFRINLEGQIEAAPPSVERFKTKVRELGRSGQSQTRAALRDPWRAAVRGWWSYYRLAEERRNIYGLEGWIRRPLRACFWQRWDNGRGRLRKLRALGLSGRSLKAAHPSQGAWRIAASPNVADGVKQRGVGTPRVLAAIRSCFPMIWKLRSTAGCGKPHGRWGGEGAGRNPRHPTRSNAGVKEARPRIQTGIGKTFSSGPELKPGLDGVSLHLGAI